MKTTDRSQLAIGLILVLLGAWFLAVQLIPALQVWAFSPFSWPLILVGIGALFGVAALVTWAPPLLVPACIVGGLGLLMYWQNLTGNWESWAYTWTLIPGFVGVGVLLSGLMRGRVRQAVTGGGWLLFISLMMFLIFGSFLGGPVLFGQFWPVLLIVMGTVLLIRALFHPRSGPPPTVIKGAS